MTKNVCDPTAVLTPAQRAVWSVNNLVTIDRDDLVAELAGGSSAAQSDATVPEPVRRSMWVAHRVALRSSRRR